MDSVLEQGEIKKMQTAMTIVAIGLVIAVLLLTYLKRIKIVDLFKTMQLVLNKSTQVSNLQISGEQKKKIVKQYIIKTFSKKILDVIAQKYSSIDAFIQFVYQTKFKK